LFRGTSNFATLVNPETWNAYRVIDGQEPIGMNKKGRTIHIKRMLDY
jgi:hypothetical protein